MSRNDGLRLIHYRGELTGQLPGGGAMAAVFAPTEYLTERLARFPDLGVAAFNGTHVVVSGPEVPLHALCADLRGRSDPRPAPADFPRVSFRRCWIRCWTSLSSGRRAYRLCRLDVLWFAT